MPAPLEPIPIKKGKGVYIYDENGKSYLDAISSWWVNLHGHCHPYIIEKIAAQMGNLEHVIFAGFTHLPAIELAERLLSLLPGKMEKIFYSDNGSTAVEAAIKMAIQYCYYLHPKRKKILCFKGSYHGDTYGAMSVSGKNSFNRPFWSQLFDVEVIDPPFVGNEAASLEQLQNILQKEECAAFIFEPLILGTGGMAIYPAQGLDPLLKLCRKHQVFTIADEVMTGFGRTGPLFACSLLSEKPDMICLAKGLTGGFLPLGVTACTESVLNGFISKDPSRLFLHGHSYTANPLACASALASLDLLEKETCTAQRRMIAESHTKFSCQLKQDKRFKRVESLGTILALEYRSETPSSYFHPLRDRLYQFFLEQAILLRPLGNVIYVMPPYCITYDELQHINHQIALTVEKFS